MAQCGRKTKKYLALEQIKNAITACRENDVSTELISAVLVNTLFMVVPSGRARLGADGKP